MSTRRWGGAAVALLGLTAFGAAVAWFGIAKTREPGEAVSASAAAPGEADASPVRVGQDVALPTPGLAGSAEVRRGQAEPSRQAQSAKPAEPSKQTEPARQADHSPGLSEQARIVAAAETRKASAPSFDVVRIEPNGESVIAGRGAPGATVDLLRNGRSHARAIADTSGLFAFVPPPLPPGSHEIGLTSIAPDGTRAQSRESVTVVISDDRLRKPLVTLTSPDRPTVVLSAPDSPEPKKPAAETAVRVDDGGVPLAGVPNAATQPASPPGQGKQLAARPNVKIKSVETEEGGRLFVSGDAAAGATVRLYLNDSFVAPGGTGSDGKVSFAIGGGVRPGDYRVRLDDVDPVSGDVRSRAEVAFNVPAPLTLPLPPQAEPLSPDAPLEGRAVAGTEPAPSGQAPLLSALPPARGVAPAQDANREGSREASRESSLAPRLTGPAERSPAAEAGSGSARWARGADPGTVIVPEINTAIVSRGDNLWRISRRIYGIGTRYTVIYDANQTQIRNPDRIYPGQIFVLPAGQAPAGPASTAQAPTDQAPTGQGPARRTPGSLPRSEP